MLSVHFTSQFLASFLPATICYTERKRREWNFLLLFIHHSQKREVHAYFYAVRVHRWGEGEKSGIEEWNLNECTLSTSLKVLFCFIFLPVSDSWCWCGMEMILWLCCNMEINAAFCEWMFGKWIGNFIILGSIGTSIIFLIWLF